VTPPRLLHVANGTATTETIHEAGIPGSSSIWADPLHEGPVPGQLTDAQLLDVRARYLASGGESGVDPADTIAELRRWREVIDDHESYDELVLWYEHDLFDQLNLIQLLSRIGQTLPMPRQVSLICVGSLPGHPRFKGLGELTPDELGSLFETRRPLSDAQYELAARAWEAFRASDPRPLSALLGTDTSALPFLAPALERHLEEYPWTRDGLSRTERKLMTLAQQGPIDIWTAFPQMHDDETAFYIADQSFWQTITGLESATPPLVTVTVTSDVPGRLPTGTIALTDTGRAVLGGRVDRVERCGIDRWLGGVHLTGADSIWRWDHAQQRIVTAPAGEPQDERA
jgi:hypothetical protein